MGSSRYNAVNGWQCPPRVGGLTKITLTLHVTKFLSYGPATLIIKQHMKTMKQNILPFMRVH